MSKVADLTPPLTEVDDDDLIYVVDVSDKTDGGDGTSKQAKAKYVKGQSITQGEINISVTPVDYSYPPGNVFRYGAAGNGTTDDSSAVKNALDVAFTNRVPAVFPGGYTFRVATSKIIYITNDIEVIGSGLIKLDNASITIRTYTSDQVESGNTAVTLSSAVSRGDLTVTLDDASDVVPGMSLFIQDTSDQVETNWGVNAAEIHIVVSKSGNVVTLDRPMLWDYATGGGGLEVVYQDNHHVTLKNLNIEVGGGAVSTFRVFHSSVTAENLYLYDPDEGDNRDGLTLRRCVNASIDGIRLHGLRYGVVVLWGLDTVIQNIYARKCRHPVDPQEWADNTIIRDMTAIDCDAAYNSHPCFNLTYENCQSLNDSLAFRLRGLGIVLRDCYLHSTSDTSSYVHRVVLSDQSIAEEYKLLCDNVVCDLPSLTAAGRGLGCNYAGRATFRDCRAPSIESGSQITVLDGCEIGQVRVDDGSGENPTHLTVNDCIIDGDLYFSGTTRGIYMDSVSLVDLHVNGTNIKNVGIAFLEQADVSALDVHRVVINSSIESISTTFVSGGAADIYSFIGCTLKNSDGIAPIPADRLRAVDCVTYDTTVAAKMLVNQARTFTSADATPSVAYGSLFKTAGTTTITDFDDGVLGQQITILATDNITITDGAPIILAGSVNFDMTDSDTLTLRMMNDQVWQEVSRSVN